MSKTFRLEGDMMDKLNQFGPRMKRAMVAAAGHVAPQAEQHMKQAAKWTDRTGNARNGLKAQVMVETNKVAIVLFHQVPYGPFLEVRWGGKYAIIEPTIAMFAPVYVETIGRLAFDGGA